MKTIITLGAVLGALLLTATASIAQPASSPNHFLVAETDAPGANCASAIYKLDVCVGGDFAADASSKSFSFLGGFKASLDAPVTGRPWITASYPFYANLFGGAAQQIHGTEFLLGPSANVTVGGVPAAVTARTPNRIDVVCPRQFAPGWQPITVTNSGGTAHLTKGVGVLPLLETVNPVEIGQPFQIRYRGNQGDLIYMAVTSLKSVAPAVLPPYHHGLELNLAGFLGLVGPFPVFNRDGTFTLSFPGVVFPRPIYVQMLALPTKNNSYEPGSFTNLISL